MLDRAHILDRASWGFLTVVSVLAVVSLFYRGIDTSDDFAFVYVGAAIAVSLGFVWLLKSLIAGSVRILSDWANLFSARRWLWGCFILGVAARAVFAIAFPTELYSDQAAYISLAIRLAEDGVYELNNMRSLWPPGMPFLYLVGVAIFGWQSWLALVINLLLFAGMLFVVHRLTARILGVGPSRISALIVAIWPNLVILGGYPSKELLIAFLLPSAVLLYLTATYDQWSLETVLALIGCGICLGFAALTQPSTALFVFVFLLFELRIGKFSKLGRWFLVVGIGVLTVMPWTVRNYVIHESFVPISTSGGLVLLTANNPDATGGWIEMNYARGMEDEIEGNRQAYSKALNWIAGDPVQFVKLIPIKISRFLCCDYYGAFRIFGHNEVKENYNVSIYKLFRGISNLYWYLIIALIMVGAMSSWWLPWTDRAGAILIVAPVWYFLLIHAVFESEPKHHINVVGFLAIAASLSALHVNHRAEGGAGQTETAVRN